jgi:hypothetical protein
MLDEPFDRLTRALAGGISRRAGLRLLTGATATLLPLSLRGTPVTSAQHDLNQTGWGFGPGESCISNAQCDNTYPEYPDLGLLICADTGYVYGPYGGELHCCRYEGGTCGGPLSDAHNFCCGDLLCLGGTCGRA